MFATEIWMAKNKLNCSCFSKDSVSPAQNTLKWLVKVPKSNLYQIILQYKQALVMKICLHPKLQKHWGKTDHILIVNDL